MKLNSSSVVSQPSGSSWGHSVRAIAKDAAKVCFVSSGFVASLYVWPESWGPLHAFRDLKEAATNLKYYYDRDHPQNIMKRCVSIFGVSVLGVGFLVWDTSRKEGQSFAKDGGKWSIFRSSVESVARTHFFNKTALSDIGTAVGVTAVLFAGVIATKVFFPSERVLLPDASATDSDEAEENANASMRSNSNRPDLGGPARSPKPSELSGDESGNVGYSRQGSSSFKIPKDASRELYKLRHRRHLWQILRNLVFAPIAEEIVFRAVLWKVLSASDVHYPLSVKYAILAIGFSFAHAHHVGLHAIRRYQQTYDPLMEEQVYYGAWNYGLKVTATQLVITAVFTVFNTFIYTRAANRNIIAACAAHSFCNYLGPPSLAYLGFSLETGKPKSPAKGKASRQPFYKRMLSQIRNRVQPSAVDHGIKLKIISISYGVGVVGFIACAVYICRKR